MTNFTHFQDKMTHLFFSQKEALSSKSVKNKIRQENRPLKQLNTMQFIIINVNNYINFKATRYFFNFLVFFSSVFLLFVKVKIFF